MATDNSPPRLKLIVTIGSIVVVTVGALNFVFTSYYGIMTDEATRSKLAPTQEKYDQQKAEAAALAAANIDKAMAELAKGNRTSITPEQSTDTGAMTGWAKLPKPLPAAPTPKPAGDAVVPNGDGGVATPPGDAGAPGASADAGVRRDGPPSKPNDRH